MAEAAVRVTGVHKRFGGTVALDALAFEIPKGSVCGLVGPNGAGKTTAISLLLGLMAPTAGDVRVLGLDPRKDGFTLRQRIGYVPEKHHIYSWMRAEEVLRFASEIYPKWDPAEAARITELLRLPRDRKVSRMSRGEVAKLALAIALAHRPELLILDEPTSGLDPLVRRDVLDAIIGLLSAEGRTVVFSSHILSDIERVADRVILIDRGRKVTDAPLESLRSRFVRVSFLFADGRSETPAVPFSLRVEGGPREWNAIVERAHEDETRAWATQNGATTFLVQPISIEDAIVELMRIEQGAVRC
jgi:ABC-2 type transport system ATP-binding protein